MKNTIKIIILMAMTLINDNLFAQAPYLRFRKPTTTDNVTFKFAHVVSGTDAFITIVRSRNASISRIDDSSSNPYAWQPFIDYGRTNNSADTSYIDFKITFKNSSNGSDVSLSKMALCIVDIDGSGSGSYREMVAASKPSTPKGILGSTITTVNSVLNNIFISGTTSFSSIDTNNSVAMAQVDYTNVNTFNLRVGVVGRVSSSTTRQSSFYFKPFSSMNLVLPVKLIDLKAEAQDEVNTISWKTTSEENANRFEVYKSLDGVNFTLAGEVAAAGFSQSLQSYNFSDASMSENVTVFYRLKLIDNDGSSSWTKILSIAATNAETTKVQSVYPNPTNGVLNINFSQLSDNAFIVQVIDAFGKVFQEVNSDDLNGMSTVSFDLTELNTGIYFVKVSGDCAQTQLTKFIKN